MKPDPIFPGERFDEHASDLDAWRADQERLKAAEDAAHGRIDRALGDLGQARALAAAMDLCFQAASKRPYRSVLDAPGDPAPLDVGELHARAGGDLCTEDPATGLCSACCASLETCPTCHGRGYHRDTCDHPDGWHDPMPDVKGTDILPERSAARDSWTLDRMAEVMREPEWSPDTLDELAELLRSTGREY